MAGGADVQIRSFEGSDVDAVVDEFNETWGGATSRLSPGESLALSRHFVFHFLRDATRADVAVLDGAIVGVIVTRIAGNPPIYEWVPARMERTDAALEASSAAAKTELAKARRWHSLDKEIERASDLLSGKVAEVELFLVSPKARGHGVGRSLWGGALEYFRANDVKTFFLHTDTSCDMGFYDHQGLRRVSELSLRPSSPTLQAMARRDVPGKTRPSEELFLCVGSLE
ncbi:GNAT family N-acetyltransferase [uncultured Bifidobacterium sp.]|uniref:GNAT family N-acetyltransferase n=1 Tax=uncultured Bifidobacterium sp. TaxID=165187 RepID=UPI002608FA99|nr:GNAT family N-acetyltransferase [uncultured Bifidobacterium sp.]